VNAEQGDQIGRIFTNWATFYFGYFFVKITFRNSANIYWAPFFHGKICALIFTRNGLGYILGDFFTNSSGHPDAD
jgi:hypothetical protein